jgi:hypothetical protein
MQRIGADPDGQFGVITAEELHWGCAGIALAIQGSGLAAAGIAASGTPEQIAEWVPQCFGTDDEIQLGAYAVTEPQAGSDVKSLKSTATLDGDEWVLNGTKVFITNGGIADVHVVVATVDPAPASRPGLLRVGKGPRAPAGQEESKIGIRASHRRGDPRGLPDPVEPARRMDKLNKLERAARAEGGIVERPGDLRDDPADRGRSALGIAQAATSGRSSTSAIRPSTASRRSGAADPAGAGGRRDGDRGGPAARLAGGLDGPQRSPDDRGPGLDVEAQGRRVTMWATTT